MVEEWTPAWPGQRPPFANGNTLSLRHGARSPRLIEPEAQALVEAVLADEELSYLRAPRWRPVLQNWARVQRQADRYGDWLEKLSVEEQSLPPRGGAKSPVDTWLSMVRTATGLADKLGLTPTSAARLSRDMSAAGYMAGLQRPPLYGAVEQVLEAGDD